MSSDDHPVRGLDLAHVVAVLGGHAGRHEVAGDHDRQRLPQAWTTPASCYDDLRERHSEHEFRQPRALAAVTGRVPHYSGTAVVIGSLVFLVLLAAFVGMAYLKRRR